MVTFRKSVKHPWAHSHTAALAGREKTIPHLQDNVLTEVEVVQEMADT